MKDFHSLTWKDVLKEKKSSQSGLSDNEVQERLDKFGLNQLQKEKPLGAFKILIAQLKSPLVYVLVIAGIISFILGEEVDTYVIFGAVFINTIIGFIQENKANKALSKLRKMVEHKVVVMRDGHEKQVLSKNIVPGDIIILEPGNRVPADIRIIESKDLKINEATLTGESVPTSKTADKIKVGSSLADRNNMAYAGTVVVSGSGRGVVVATAQDTEIGRISSLVHATTEEKTPLQNRLTSLSKTLGIVVGIISLLIVLLGISQGRDFFEMFIVAIAVAVSVIPEGMIVAVTVILVLGMQQILKRKALVRKLIAAETLGSTTVICTDKTGTLTEGNMQVSHIIIGDDKLNFEKDKHNEENIAKDMYYALRISVLCNNAVVENPDNDLEDLKLLGLPTEKALLLAGIQAGLDKDSLEKEYERIEELPFSSDTKFMATLHKRSKDYRLYEKGAPERVLDKSTYFHHEGEVKKITSADKKKLIEKYESYTSKGLRLIAVAYKKIGSADIKDEKKVDLKEHDKDLVFLGFLALKDPLRPDVAKTIEVCRGAGIRPIVITGDHALTAKAIAQEIGFKITKDSIVSGEDLDNTSDEDLQKIVKKASVFARVSPHHKLRIVKALQSQEEIVAMTGDGINDSPALKAADIGVCLGSGTDIAKETSDIVLLDNNFKVIVNAVRQGRVIFNNIRKVITYLLADSFSQVILIVGSIILGYPLAILPAQILWINIVNDGFPSFSLAFEKGEDGLMKKKPISQKEPLINKEMKTIIFIAGIIRDFFYFAIFLYFIKINLDISYIRTIIFAIIGVNSLLYVFSLRSLMKPIWKMKPFSNTYLNFATLASLGLLIIAIYFAPLQKALQTVPLNLNDWFLVLGVSLVNIILIEISKFYFIKKEKNI
ncbi:HAD-IC family P-type ATPase [Patescibacteria group bacterium]|nr:HAD-IC family P-type ATPase [Patescibacteria group bacterium]